MRVNLLVLQMGATSFLQTMAPKLCSAPTPQPPNVQLGVRALVWLKRELRVAQTRATQWLVFPKKCCLGRAPKVQRRQMRPMRNQMVLN